MDGIEIFGSRKQKGGVAPDSTEGSSMPESLDMESSMLCEAHCSYPATEEAADHRAVYYVRTSEER